MSPSLSRIFQVSLLWMVMCSTSKAQTSDLEIWSRIGYTLPINKKVELRLNEALRFHENGREFKTHFTQFTSGYKFNKWFSSSLGLRFVQKANLKKHYQFEYLWFLSSRIKLNQNRIQWNYRIRFQQKYSAIRSSEKGTIPNSDLRNKLSVSYDLRKSRFSPFVAGELFNGLSYDEQFEINKARLTIGVGYETKNNHRWSFFFRLQEDVAIIAPASTKIIGINLALKQKKKN